MTDPQSLYKSGTPGRGKGTIIQGPNLGPMFAAAANRAMKAKADQDKDRQDAAKQLATLSDLGDKGFSEDYEYNAKLRDDFTKKITQTYLLYNGEPPITEVAVMMGEKNKVMNKLQQSQRQGEEFWHYQREYMKTGLDPDVRDEGIRILNEWRELKPEDRPDLTQFINDKRFDLNKFQAGLISNINKEADKVAANGGIQKDAAGRYVDVKSYIYTKQSTAEKIVSSNYYNQDQYQRTVDKDYKRFMNGQASVEVSIPVYEVSGGRVVEKTEKKTVTSVDDYLKYVEVPSYMNLKQDDKVSMAGGGLSIGFNTPTSADKSLQQTAELNVKGDGKPDDQYGLAANSYASISGYNMSPSQPGSKSRKGAAFPGSYSLDENKAIDNTTVGDLVVIDHYNMPVTTEDIPLDAMGATDVRKIDPSTLYEKNGQVYLKKGSPVPTQYRNDPKISGKLSDSDYVTYEIVYSYNVDGTPKVKKQFTVDAKKPQVRQWLDANMMEDKGQKFTEWYFKWPQTGAKPRGVTPGKNTSSGNNSWNKYKRN